MSDLDKFSHFIDTFVSYFNVKFSLFWSVKYSPMALCVVCCWVKLAKILYLITQHVHTTFKISTSFNSKNIPIEIFFIMKKRPKIHIMVCKILIDGVMVVKLGKIVYLFTQHIHTTFEIPTSFISLNIPVQMLFLYKKR